MNAKKDTKKDLVRRLIQFLEDELVASKSAALATYEAATDEENKPENEYDTRALEASYLAGAQAKRAGEIDEVISMFKNTHFIDFPPGAPIQSTALVRVRSEKKTNLFFLMPLGGGFSLKLENGDSVQIMTPHSLLGEGLLGLRQGEVAEVEINGRVKEFEILEVS